MKKLHDKNIQERCTAILNEQIQVTTQENTDTLTRSQNIIDVISKTAYEVLPEKKLANVTTNFKDGERFNELLNSRSDRKSA